MAAVAGLFALIRVLLGPAPSAEPTSTLPLLRPVPITQPVSPALAAPSDQSPSPSIRFTSSPVDPSYTVVAGDNLWTIAQRFNTTVEAIQWINSLPDRSTLRVGQRLVIP